MFKFFVILSFVPLLLTCHSASDSTSNSSQLPTVAATTVTASNLAGSWSGAWTVSTSNGGTGSDTETVTINTDNSFLREVKSTNTTGTTYTDYKGTWSLSGDVVTLITTNSQTSSNPISNPVTWGSSTSSSTDTCTAVLVANHLYLSNRSVVAKGQTGGTSIVDMWTSQSTSGSDTYVNIWTFSSSGQFSLEFKAPGSDTTTPGTYTVSSDGTLTLTASSTTVSSKTATASAAIATLSGASYLLATQLSPSSSGTLESTSYTKQ